MKVVNHGPRDCVQFLLIVTPSPSIFAILSWIYFLFLCQRNIQALAPLNNHLVLWESEELFATAKVFHSLPFLSVPDACRRGGDAPACAGHSERWPGLGPLGKLLLTAEEGRRGESEAFPLPACGGRGWRSLRLLSYISRAERSPSMTVSKDPDSGPLFFAVWACMCVGGGALIIGYRLLPFILLLKGSHG